MKHPGIIYTYILLCSFLAQARGQDVTQPVSPLLDLVTVDPNTGFVWLSWLPGGSPDVGSYVIYTYNNNTAFAIDTVMSPYITAYTHTGSAARYRSVTYVVAAMDSSLNISPLSNNLSTIYLSAVNDTCNGRINLSWTAYSNASHPASGYGIYLSVDGSPVTLIKEVPTSSSSFSLNGYMPDIEYCFYIAALDGNIVLSSSNMQCLTSGSEGSPAWTKTVSVSVEDKMMIISGSYDPSSDIRLFRAERLSPTGGSWTGVEIVQGADGRVSMTDITGDTSIVNLFRIAAVNNCGTAVAVSTSVRNIVLSAISEGTAVRLRWNDPFISEASLFTLWRNAGQGYEQVVTDLSDTIWSDDYTSYASFVSRGEIAYYITAIREGAPPGETSCRSSTAVISAIETIFVANAFTPNDDGLNDTFAPVLSFTPLSYEFNVYSRLGVLLFHTTSHGTGWDGRHRGKSMPAGAYLWSLRVTTPSGHSELRSGTVTILP